MLFNLFTDKVIPHDNVFKGKDGKYYTDNGVVSQHSEKKRPEYDYVWNSDGIRSIDFSEKPNVITLGCSITFGLGMPNDLIWPSLLESKMKKYGNYKVGNISYNGAAPMKSIISFFNFIRQYEYLPEYVICNFPNLERAYFVNSEATQLADLFWYSHTVETKGYAPFEWNKILPVEWIYFQNLDYIKMLELFCKFNGIKLIWSTWSTNFSEEMENFLQEKFLYYVPDKTRIDFPDGFEYPIAANTLTELIPYFRMKDWDSVKCHYQDYLNHRIIFDHAYDYERVPVSYIPKSDGLPFHPHPGFHRHLHWADFYFEEIKKNEDSWN